MYLLLQRKFLRGPLAEWEAPWAGSRESRKVALEYFLVYFKIDRWFKVFLVCRTFISKLTGGFIEGSGPKDSRAGEAH